MYRHIISAVAALALLPGLALAQGYPTPTLQWLNITRSHTSLGAVTSNWFDQTLGGAVTGGSGPTFNTKITSENYGTSWGQWNLFTGLTLNGAATVGQNVALYSQAQNFASGGTAANRQLWAGVFEARDSTGAASSTSGVTQAVEIDLYANGLDDLGAQIGRSGLVVVIGQANTGGTEAEVTYGMNIAKAGGHTAHIKRGVGVSVDFSEAAFDTRSGTQRSGAHAIWLKNDHDIALDTAGAHVLRYDSGSGRLKYYVSGVAVFSIDDSGNLRAAGTVTGSTTP